MPIFQLSDSILFPPPHLAEEGLLAVGGDLSSERLLAAYKSGIFPWYSEEDPILWWSPDPRVILRPSEIHIARRLKRTIRQDIFEVRADSAFSTVIERCASTPRPGEDGTWIFPEMIDAYTRLHELGYAHSIECWRNNELVGGLYGVSVGACFFAESMYSHVDNASKIALTALALQCCSWDFTFIDCQFSTSHLIRMGVQSIPREIFLEHIEKALCSKTRRGIWQLNPDLFSQL